MCISDSRISDDDMIEIFPVFELSKETESEPRPVSTLLELLYIVCSI